ncbi:MAG: HTTM domain-containing protein, partial [Dyadobacter sp.]
AKLRFDWLFEAQPLRIWLAANQNFPVIGPLLTETWVAFLLSWFALFFDLSAPFFLSFKRTRIYMYGVIVVFHLLTHFLFYIGMFPWMMIFTALIFFPSKEHQKVMQFVFGRWKQLSIAIPSPNVRYFKTFVFLFLFFSVQLFMPFRSRLYGGNVLWHEQGFRFSWNIMLMEKNASLEYEVKVKGTGKQFTVRPNKFLTRIQARQCSFQPDMILQFAHILHQYYLDSGVGDTEIRAICYASVNGHGSKLLINPNVDLTKQQDSFARKSWITDWEQ